MLTWRRAAVVVAVPVLLLAGVEIADAASTAVSGGAVSKVVTVTLPDATTTSSSSFVDVPGAALTVTVPSGQRALLLSRFTAESVCYDGQGWCSVRVVVDGVEANPVVGLDFAFDSSANGTAVSSGWQGHAVDRSKVVGAGTHTVKVQYATTDPATSFRLDDASFTVERSAVG